MKKQTLAEIQAAVKAPKNQFNSFGKYKYRSAEDIVEAVKLVVNPMGYFLILEDEIIQVGGRIYVKATATLSDGENHYSATGWAREEESKKGMDGSQITGAASSYARKYALNGLFAIDDTKDSDATNTHGKEVELSEIDKLIKAYDNDLDIALVLDSCETMLQLKNLYLLNQKLIDANKDLKNNFTNKKTTINGKS